MTAPILITGFEPFGGDAVNPSWEVARALHGEVLEGHPVQALCLPCVFGDSLTRLLEVVGSAKPVLVLATGLASGRAALSFERVAVNVDDARIPDNAGAQPVDQPVVPGAPVAYWSTLPIKAMAAALREAGVNAEVSQTAGTFVCNHVFYGLMHHLRRRRLRAGFMHLPRLPQGCPPGVPSLPLRTQVHGTRLALRTALLTAADLRSAEGSIA